MASVRKEGKGRGFYLPGVHLAISGDYSVVTTGEVESDSSTPVPMG